MLQQSLGIPAAFTLSKGFIKELRVHIPWSSISSAPVEVTFTGVECVLNFNPAATTTPSPSTSSTPPTTPRTTNSPPHPTSQTAIISSSSSPPPSTDPPPPPSEDSGGWASDLITKIIANLSIHVDDLSLKYLEGNVCACLRLHSLSLHSTDPSWRSTDFMDLLGPWKLIHKALTIHHLSFFLYPDDGGGGPVKNERVCILQRLSISCRIKSYLAALGATADISSWSTNTLATTATPASLLPSAAVGGGVGLGLGLGVGGVGSAGGLASPNVQALPRPLPPPCGPAITVDVHVMETVDLSLSSYQFERLHSIIQSKSDFYATSAAAARVAQSIAAVPAVIAQQDQHSKEDKKRTSARPRPTGKRGGQGNPSAQSAAQSSGAAQRGGRSGGGEGGGGGGGGTAVNGKGEAKGWMSWMWDFVAAEEEEDEGEVAVVALKESGGAGGDDHRAEFLKAMGHLARPTRSSSASTSSTSHCTSAVNRRRWTERRGGKAGERGRRRRRVAAGTMACPPPLS